MSEFYTYIFSSLYSIVIGYLLIGFCNLQNWCPLGAKGNLHKKLLFWKKNKKKRRDCGHTAANVNFKYHKQSISTLQADRLSL